MFVNKRKSHDGLVYITRPYAEGEHWSVQEHDLIFLHAKGQRHLL